ncbi:MAG: energy-coupling factor transporter transmembrane component T [Anaerolineaceae bacterium]|jgi:energy-coupling factor transport system permease protein|nr:energy-coupling factor transporter transmembrane component T [Anaerolineaceae bacterium]
MLVTWRYRPRKSLIQSFDPRAWLIFFGCYMVTTVLFWDLRYLAVLLGIALLVVFTSGIRWQEMSRAWIFIGGFILFFSFLTLLTGRGGIELYDTEHVLQQYAAPFVLLGWRPTLLLSVERIFYALSMLMRVFSLASMTILIPYSLNPALYGVTFRGIGLPDKVAYAMDLTMRFIPTFGRDFTLTMDAQRARGYELEKIQGGLFAQVRKLAPLVVPVTIHAILGSEDIIDAMDLRAFGVGPRTWLQELHYRRRDRALIAFGCAMLFVASVLSLFGFGKFWAPNIF